MMAVTASFAVRSAFDFTAIAVVKRFSVTIAILAARYDRIWNRVTAAFIVCEVASAAGRIRARRALRDWRWCVDRRSFNDLRGGFTSSISKVERSGWASLRYNNRSCAQDSFRWLLAGAITQISCPSWASRRDDNRS